jgi:Rab-GTPase-TBC domain
MGDAERRSQVTVEFKSKRLGMFLQPSEPATSTGATLVSFEPIDNLPGEAEASGVIHPGYRLAAINDQNVFYSKFQTIIAALVNSGRPIRLRFRSLEAEFKDRFGFLRSKMHILASETYFESQKAEIAKSDKDWLNFLTELGGKKGVTFGVARLMRDAKGEICFPCEPVIRLNAVSPIHGKMQGISSNDVQVSSIETKVPSTPSRSEKNSAVTSPSAAELSPSSQSAPATPSSQDPAQQSAAVASSAGISSPSRIKSPSSLSPSRFQDDGSPIVPFPSSSTASGKDAEKILMSVPAAVIVNIYKRCWSPLSIGVTNPPGLDVNFPGEVPKPKQKEKWDEMLNKLILTQGIPVAYRSTIWYEVSGAHAKAALHPPGYYATLCNMKASPEALYAIAKDVERTFPGHEMFESAKGIQSLTRVLAAFSLHDSEIGYCQGLNFVAGFLLLFMPEEYAFWTLDVMVNEILPPFFYTNSLLGVHIEQRVCAHLVEECFPNITEILSNAGITLQVITVEWFMCLFCTTLPTNTCLRLWDVLFSRGIMAVHRLLLVLFQLNADRIVSLYASSTKSSITVTSAPGPSSDSGKSASSTSTESVVVTGRTESKSWLRKRDTVAETAAKVMAAVSSISLSSSAAVEEAAAEGDGNGEPGSPSASGEAGGISTPVARGGTVRSAAATFPALYSLLKAMPNNAHDVGKILRMAFPTNAKEANSLGALDWNEVLSPARLTRLRAAAKAQISAEMEETNAVRASKGLTKFADAS